MITLEYTTVAEGERAYVTATNRKGTYIRPSKRFDRLSVAWVITTGKHAERTAFRNKDHAETWFTLIRPLYDPAYDPDGLYQH